MCLLLDPLAGAEWLEYVVSDYYGLRTALSANLGVHVNGFFGGKDPCMESFVILIAVARRSCRPLCAYPHRKGSRRLLLP